MKTHKKNSVNRAVSKKKNTTEDFDVVEVPMVLAGMSESLDEEGNVVRRSRRYSMQAGKVGRQNAAVIQAIELIVKNHNIKPIPRIKAPKTSLKDLAVLYIMGDPHIGMHAWGRECGADFNLKIAERDLCNAILDLVDRSPAGEYGVLINLGDFLHMDNMRNQTERSGNVLDADTRWPLVLQKAVMIQEFMIRAMLKKHKKVRLINEIGNHDTQSAHAIMLIMEARFRENPRVEIDSSPMRQHYWDWGQTFISTTHGDMCRMPEFPALMCQHPKWSQTRFHYGYTGHVHHLSRIEKGGAVVESFRTLAPKDAWHAGMGYTAGREMVSIVLHKKHGEIQRLTAPISLVEELAARGERKSK